jgi:hypothetical protein
MLHQQLRDRQDSLVKLVKDSEVIHNLYYKCNFQTGRSLVQLLYEVRDSELWLYSASAEGMARSGDVLGDDVLSSVAPGAAELTQSMCERSQPMEHRIGALLGLLELMGEHDLGV